MTKAEKLKTIEDEKLFRKRAREEERLERKREKEEERLERQRERGENERRNTQLVAEMKQAMESYKRMFSQCSGFPFSQSHDPQKPPGEGAGTPCATEFIYFQISNYEFMY